MSAQTIQIIDKSFFTNDILRLRLKGETAITFSAGQYILLGSDADNLKPFSIAAAPDGTGEIECHIRNHDNSDWMQELFAKEIGDTLHWMGPNDQMKLEHHVLPTIFVAGGTGFAPMKALLEALLKEQPIQPIHFYWGARQPDDLYQNEWLEQLASEHDNINYIPVISEPNDDWQGATGLVHKQVLADYPLLEHHMVYLCGPWNMVQAAKQEFIDAGLEEKHFIA